MDVNFDLAERKYAQNLVEFMSLILEKQDLERMTPIQKIMNHQGFYIPHHDPELVYKYHLHTVKLDDLFIDHAYQGTILQYYDYDRMKKIDLIFASDYNIALFVNLCMKDNNQFIDMMRKLMIHEQDYLFSILKTKIKPQIYELLNKKLTGLHQEVMVLDDVIKIKDDIDDMIFKKIKEYYSENLEMTKGGPNYISFLKYDPRGTLGGKEGYYLNMQDFHPLINEIDEMLRSKLEISESKNDTYMSNESLWFLKQAVKLKNSLSELYINVNSLPIFINDVNYLYPYLETLIKTIPFTEDVNAKSMENDIMIRFCILICIIGHLCGNNINKFRDIRAYMKKYYADNEASIIKVAELIKLRLLEWIKISVEPYRHTYMIMIGILNKLNLISTNEEKINFPLPNFKFVIDVGFNLKSNIIFASNISVVLLQQICSTDQFQLADLLMWNVMDPSTHKEILDALSKNFSSYLNDETAISKYTSLHTYHTKIVGLVYDMISYNINDNVSQKINYFTEISIDHCI